MDASGKATNEPVHWPERWALATAACAARRHRVRGLANSEKRGFLRLRPVLAGVLTATALACSGMVLAADVMRGADIYRRHCVQCHGPGGKPVLPGAPDFTSPTALLKPDQALAAVVKAGRGAMPAYLGQLREREVLDVVAHLRTLR